MLREEKTILWRTSATLLGLALPAVLLGRGLMFGCLIASVLCGLLATKGASLRGSMRLVLGSPFLWLGGCILAAAVLSSALGIAPEYSLRKTSELALAMLITFGLFLTLREMPGRHVQLVLASVVSGAAGVAVLAFVDVFVDSDRFSAALHGMDKATSYYRLNYMSSMLAVLLPFVWAFYHKRVGEGAEVPKMTAPIVLPLTMAAVFVCGGRAGWLAVLAALGVFLFMAGRYHHLNLHAKQWLAMVGTVVLGMVAFVGAHGFDVLLNRLEMTGAEQARGIGGGRMAIWEHAWAHMADSPLTGIGVNAFRYLPGNVDAHPHNMTLQIGLELGAIGSILVVGLALLLLRVMYKYGQGSIYGVAGLASVVAFITAGQFNKSVFDLEWLACLMVVALLGWRAGWSKPVSLADRAEVIHSLPRVAPKLAPKVAKKK
ncbi:MAG: O-antigen ligase family protein [Alphaproteobacteria bacterium]